MSEEIMSGRTFKTTLSGNVLVEITPNWQQTDPVHYGGKLLYPARDFYHKVEFLNTAYTLGTGALVFPAVEGDMGTKSALIARVETVVALHIAERIANLEAEIAKTNAMHRAVLQLSWKRQ